jgi:hypothetical protein
MDRRQFIGSAVLSGVVLRVSAGVTDSGTTIALFDRRFAESKLFAAQAQRKGFVALATEQDIIRLWYAGFGERCAVPGTKVMGLTLHSDLELLQSCARPFGLKIRSELRCAQRDGALVSWVLA